MSPARSHLARLHTMACVVCRRHPGTGDGRIEAHHVAEGSGLRSDWATVPLCAGHHRGEIGLHGMGLKSFLRMYRPPGESEYGLLVWLIEDMAK